MPKLSAGLLLYRVNSDDITEVLIAHPGGPFWAKKDDGAWSIPKGEYDEGEDPHTVALREFEEELGSAPPSADVEHALGEIRQPSGKRLTVWSRPGDFDASKCESNLFSMEWPKGSGQMQEFPEVDRVDWFSLAAARVKLLKGHTPFLDRLVDILSTDGVKVNEGTAGEATQAQSSQESLF